MSDRIQILSENYLFLWSELPSNFVSVVLFYTKFLNKYIKPFANSWRSNVYMPYPHAISEYQIITLYVLLLSTNYALRRIT